MKKFLIILLILPLTSLAQNPLLIPPILSGTNFNLTIQNGNISFFSGSPTQTMGVNGDILGPTIMVNKGDFITLNVHNQIADTTTIHWHGLHVAPENDGGPHTTIPPGTTWSPSFTVLDHASTYWYHPHLHHKTNNHVSKGIAGFFIVKDNDEAAINLPRNYGVDDIPVCIQTKNFDANNQIVYNSNNDVVLMANATIDPFVSLPAQVIRLRLLNGSSQRIYNLGFTGNKTFHMIGSDGGLLSVPIALTRLLLSPGERAEILVDLGGMSGQSIYLRSFASEMPNGMYGSTFPGMGAGLQMTGYNPNPLNGTDFNILKMDITTSTPGAVTTIPNTLVTVTPFLASQSNITRNLSFMSSNPGPNQLNGDFMINNAMFDMNVINYTIPLDNTEIWSLTNNSPISHPFHIHDVQFYVLDRNGATPPLSEQGRKDVVLVKPQETVRFITKFETFSNPHVPYMYHCHMLNHEDGGMMGQFIVVNPASADNMETDHNLVIYPNPSFSTFYIHAKELIKTIALFDLNGRQLASYFPQHHNTSIDIRDKVSGQYFLHIVTDKHRSIKKIMVK